MRTAMIFGLSMLLISCGMKAGMFDGKRICLDSSQYHISTGQSITGIPWLSRETLEKFDDGGLGDGILRVSYRPGDYLYDRFIEIFGEQENGYELISYSIQLLDQKSKQAYKNHKNVSDAYYLRGSYEGAVKEPLPNGLVKVYREYYTKSWELFGPGEPVNGNPQSFWYGTCLKGTPLKEKTNLIDCEFFDFYAEDYLLTVSVPENYAPHKAEIVRLITEDLNNRVFCE